MFKRGAPTGERGFSRVGVLAVAAGILVLVAVVVSLFIIGSSHKSLNFDTSYQAVLLSNGNVYFGKLENYGDRFPVLTDVFYIQSSVNPDTKQTVNVLVKRGKELHSPDRMYLNPSQIILVEPVGPNSKVMQLILEQMKQKKQQ
jgi:small nuclear ribonucleoprotein (snRNP)-like protein